MAYRKLPNSVVNAVFEAMGDKTWPTQCAIVKAVNKPWITVYDVNQVMVNSRLPECSYPYVISYGIKGNGDSQYRCRLKGEATYEDIYREIPGHAFHHDHAKKLIEGWLRRIDEWAPTMNPVQRDLLMEEKGRLRQIYENLEQSGARIQGIVGAAW